MFLALFTDSLTSVQSTSSKLRPSEILTSRKFRICVKACGKTLRVYSFHAARRSLLSLAPRTTIPAMKGDDAARVKFFNFFRKCKIRLCWDVCNWKKKEVDPPAPWGHRAVEHCLQCHCFTILLPSCFTTGVADLTANESRDVLNGGERGWILISKKIPTTHRLLKIEPK